MNNDFLSGKEFNLGMVPGEGRLPAPAIKKHLEEKIGSFGLSIRKHMINGTLDGCNTNKALLALLKIVKQLCLAHSFQLGIVKVVYVNQKKGKDDKNEFETIQVHVEIEEPQVQPGKHFHFYYTHYIVKCIAKDEVEKKTESSTVRHFHEIFDKIIIFLSSGS